MHQEESSLATVLKKESSNKIVLKGAIEETSFSDILREIALPQYSGILTVTAGKKRYRYHFKGGLIIYADSSAKRMDSTIISMIKQSGFVSRETIAKCEKMKSKMMRSLLEILVEEGHVSMLLYSKIICTAVRINILESFFIKKGTFSFELKSNIKEVQGVKPVTVLSFESLESMSKEALKALKSTISSINSTVLTSKGAPYLSTNKTLLQNFLVVEIDFIPYVLKAADDYLNKKWTKQNRFATPAIFKTASLYLFRAFLFAGIIVFFYLVTTTTAFFEEKREPSSIKNFYFFKISLMSSLFSFENGFVAKPEELIEAKMVTTQELELSGVKENSDTN